MLSRSALRPRLAAALAAGAVAALAAVGPTLASDHQDTAEVEFNPRMDINDVYAFPNAAGDRTTLIMTTASPILPSARDTASFNPNLLYQIKVDNSGDAVEDLVLQVTFEGTGAAQRVRVVGPVAPNQTGTMNTLVASGPSLTGAVNTVLGGASAMQVFAGVRGDPFFIDLEQFFRIVPDRRPASGPLSQPLTQQATSFRAPGVDFLKGISCLAIVIELPTAQLAPGANKKLGVWGTISR